jgi:hypothetical protein
VTQIVERDRFQAGVGCGRVEASPLDVPVGEAPSRPGRKHGAALVDGGHLLFEQQPHEIV